MYSDVSLKILTLTLDPDARKKLDFARGLSYVNLE